MPADETRATLGEMYRMVPHHTRWWSLTRCFGSNGNPALHPNPDEPRGFRLPTITKDMFKEKQLDTARPASQPATLIPAE